MSWSEFAAGTSQAQLKGKKGQSTQGQSPFSPALATRKLGEAVLDPRIAAAFQIAEAALRGDDLSSMSRYPDNNPVAISATEESVRLALERYEMQRDEIEIWLQRNPWPPRKD